MANIYDPLKSNPLLAKSLDGLKNRTVTTGADPNKQSLGWAENIGEGYAATELLKRADVLADLRTFYKERDGDDFASDDDLVDRFYNDRAWSNNNTVSMARDLKDAYSMSDDQTARLARIQKLYDALPNFYEKGGRGMSGLWDNTKAMVLDPANLIGFGAGKAAGTVALRAAAREAIKASGEKVLTKQLRGQIVRNAVKEGFKAGAKANFIEGAVTTAAQDTLMQTRNKELGLQDDVSQLQTLGSALTGGVMGAGVGGLFGAAGAVYGGKISRAMGKARENMFGDFTSKYTEPARVNNPDGVAATVDSEGPTPPGAAPAALAKDDAKTIKYVAAQRDQYQRNLDATIDQIRAESGEKALAEWRSGKISDENKTPAMKQADDLQAGRTALEDLYKWPKMRESLERQLEQLTTVEQPKPDLINRINELNDRISRGSDAYEAIVRAAGDGQEADFDKVVTDFANFMRNPNSVVFDVNEGRGFQAGQAAGAEQAAAQNVPIKAAAPEGEEVFTPALTPETLASADEPTITQELTKLDISKEAGTPVDAAYENGLRTRYKEMTGNDFVRTADAVADETVSDAAPAQTAVPSTAEEIDEAIGSMGKQYNALNNQISRLRKTIDAGKGTPQSQDRLTKLTAQRDAINTQRKQMLARKDELAAQQEAATIEPAKPVIRTVEAEAADAPLDVEGASGFLSQYGFPTDLIKREMGDYVKAKNPGTRDARTKVVRQYIAEKIRYARSVAHLETALNTNTEAVAYIPQAMRKLIELDGSIPADMKAEVTARYNDWISNNSQVLFAKYLTENPNLGIEDTISLIRQNHGDDMAKLIVDQLMDGADTGILQHMSLKKGNPPGWDKLTNAQKESITKKMDMARERLSGKLGSLAISPAKLEGLLELQKQNMVLETLAADFDVSVRTSAGKLGDAYPVIVDPDTKGTVSGKVWEKKTGDDMPTIDQRDKFGLQSLLKKAQGGKATGIDEYGDLVIEHPFFGNLRIQDIVRAPDGSIDYARTVDGKYIVKELPNGRKKYIPRRYDPAESARRALEQSIIENKTNRIVKVTRDVANLKAGQKGVTAKQLAAAEIEASRTSDTRKAMNRKGGNWKGADEQGEELDRTIRQLARKAVIKDAVDNAMVTAPDAPEAALAENIAAAQTHIGEEIPLKEIEQVWAASEADNRSVSVEAVRKQRVNEAVEAFRIHNDPETLTADLNRINSELSTSNVKPRPHADKPAGAVAEPLVYVYKGWEVDVRNQFSYKKTSDNTRAISFMGEKVGDLKVNKDGSATLLYTDPSGLETSIKATSVEQIAPHLPRIFGSQVEAAGAAGKLTRSFDEVSDSVYPIDWKSSNTWGKQKRTVPVETPVDQPAKAVGQIQDFKSNPDVSAINVEIPDGHVLAVHILEGDFKGVTRVENIKSTTPQTVGQILGNQKGKAYTVGFVPEGTKSASRDATRLFKAVDGADPIYRAGAPDQGSARGKTPNIDQDELGQIKLEGMAKIGVDQSDLPIQFRDKGLTTLAKVHDLITAMENVPWAKISSQGNYATFVKDIADLYEVRAKYAPKGIKMPTASRIQSMSQWNKIMSGKDGTSIATGIDILRRLSFNDRDLPIIGEKDMPGNAGGYALPMAGSDDANRIFLNPSAFNPDGTGNVIPQPVALIHEIGHWAYMNILSDADRLQFWQSLGKYFDGDSVDMYAIQQRLPGISPDGEQMSPAEFFANQFSQWAVTQGKVNNIPLWSKMAKAIVQIAEAFGVRLRGDRAMIDENLVDIDPDFAELFAKILPESNPMYDRYVGIHKTLEDIRGLNDSSHIRTASTAANTLVAMDDMRMKLDDAIQTANPMDLENALDEVSRRLYGMVGGKAGAVKHRPKGGEAVTGQGRLRLFDGKAGSKKFGQTARARAAMMKAHYEWREFQKELHSDARAETLSKYKEMSTDDTNIGSASGDLNSSFEEMANLAYSTMDDDLLSALNFHANNLMNAINIGQDEARQIISRTGKLEGKNIRVFKDGNFETYEQSGYQTVQRNRAARRAASQQARAEQEIANVMQEIETGRVSSNDRDALPQSNLTDSLSYASVKDMTSGDLAREYKSLAGVRTPRKKELEAEIKARVATIPEVKIKPIDPEFEDIPVRALEKDLLQSIKRGRFDDMNKIANAIAWKKRANLTEGLITADSPKVRKAVKILNNQASVGSSDNGLPNNMPLQIRETVRNISHRSRTDEGNSRMVAQRLIAILGKGGDSVGEEGFVTGADLGRILGIDSGDSTPVTDTDPIFKAFRDEMRAIGTMVKTDAGKVQAAQKISRMAINALIDPDEITRLGTNADELASAFVASMRGKGSIDAIFEDLPDSARSRISDLLKENMSTTALVMRGMLTGDARKELQPMTFFGDLLKDLTENNIFRSAVDLTAFRGVHPAIADNYRNEFVKTLTPKRRSIIERYAAKPADESVLFYDGNGTVPFDMLETRGTMQAPVTDGQFGTGVYLKRSVQELDDAFPNEDIKWASGRITSLRDRISRELANIEGMRSRGFDVTDYRAEVLQPLVNSLHRAVGTEAGLWRQIRATEKVAGQPKVIPFIPRAMNSFDFSPSTEYTFGSESPTSLDWLVSKLVSDDMMSPADADALKNSVTTFDGNEAYGQLKLAVANHTDADPNGAANALNEALKSMGFDSIDTGEGVMMFDSNNVRHISDPNFSMEDYVDAALDGDKVSVAGQLLETMMQGNVNRKDVGGFINSMQAMGIPSIVADVHNRFFQGKSLSPADVEKVSWFTKAFGENSARIRKSGAHWLADKIKPTAGAGFFEKIDTTAAKSLMVSKDANGRPISLLTAIRNLPDAGNFGKRWMERNKFWGKVPQPASHDAIIMALRQGDQYVDMLPPKLRAVANDIRKYFRQELTGAIQDGLPIGFRRNYVPQVWDADRIKEDPNAFVGMMKQFFMQEMNRGEVPIPSNKSPAVAAEEKAMILMRTLTEEGGDGVLLPDNALRTRMEQPFFERVLNFSPDQIPNAQRFMINDLEGILVKYADQMTRRRLMTKEFGLGNHAVSTYMNILVNGKAAIVDALRNTRENVADRVARDATMDTRVRETQEVLSAVPGTKEEVEDIVDTAMQILGDTPAQWRKNKERVRNYFMNVQDPAVVAAQPEYAKRVDAIVNALAEFGGMPSGIPDAEIRAMTDTIGAVIKKPRDRVDPTVMKFSRNMRTFNNISLLAFTTLASIPDIGMPMIRSGNLMAGMRAWRNYMTDPYYREMARNVGVGLENTLHERMGHMYNDTTSRASNAFFNLTFLNDWTNVQREAAALVGFESFKAEASRAQDMIARGMQNTRQYNNSLRFLQRYGLERYAQVGAPSLSNADEMVNNDALRYAIMRFTNESIFAPNPNDIPLWAQHPVGQMVFQLKSYPLMMGRMSKYVVDEALKGNPKNLMMLLASSGVLGTSSLAIRDAVQQRGDNDGDGKAEDTFRDRYATDSALTGSFIRWYNSVATDMGLDVKAHGTADAVIGWLTEAFMVAGGFGIFADILHTAVEQADNRAYGTLRTMGAVLGPSFSVAADATQAAQVGLQHVFSEKDPSQGDNRNAVRVIVGRTPVLGSVRAIREAVVDAVAGEASDSSGGGKGGGKGKNKIL